MGERSKLVLDHDPAQPVAVYVSSLDTDEGLEATFRVPAGERGDQILAEAGDLRDGLSVAADVIASDDRHRRPVGHRGAPAATSPCCPSPPSRPPESPP